MTVVTPLAGAAAVTFATLAGEMPFGFLRLGCYALFLHGTIIGAGAAWIFGRNQRRWTAGLALSATLVLAFAAWWSFLFEPHWLEVSHCEVRSPKLSRPLKVAVLADFQSDEIGAYEREVLTRVVAEKPDLIIMPGDYIHHDDLRVRAKLRADFRRLLSDVKFDAPLGVYAVAGDFELDDWKVAFEGTAVHVIERRETFDVGGIRLTGLSYLDSCNASCEVGGEPGFHLVFGHRPDCALGRIDADLIVAGHCHGGQVRIPFFGPPIIASQVPRSWTSGMTTLPGGRKLIVSRGTGMERGPAPQLRFNCRPEIVMIDLLPEPATTR